MRRNKKNAKNKKSERNIQGIYENKPHHRQDHAEILFSVAEKRTRAKTYRKNILNISQKRSAGSCPRTYISRNWQKRIKNCIDFMQFVL